MYLKRKKKEKAKKVTRLLWEVINQVLKKSEIPKKKKKSQRNCPHGENMYERLCGRPIHGGPLSDCTESNKTSYF